MSCRRGIGRVEIIAIIAVLALLPVVAVVILGAILVPSLSKAKANARLLKDSTQIKQIHQACVIWGRDRDGALPIPSQFVFEFGQAGDIPDYTLDHTASLYSMLIAQDYISPEIVVGSTEVGDITVYDAYDYDAYQPDAGSFWDTGFSARIDQPSLGAHASFTHATFAGDRRTAWADGELDAGFAVFGHRAPRGGATTGPDHDRSPTLRLHGPRRIWQGAVCFGDNHVDVLASLTSWLTTYENKPDNPFAADFEHEHGAQAAADSFLSISIEADQWTVKDVYDPLD